MSTDPFLHAVAIIGKVLARGAATHEEGEWMHRPVLYHLQHVETHLRAYQNGDQLEDHLAHACCRLLMALSLRGLDR